MSLLLAVSLGYYMTIPPKPREFPAVSAPKPPLAPTKKVPPPLPPTKEERNDLLGILGRPVVLEDGSLGTQVGQVFPGSPAQRVGLEPGDVIARVDGRPFVSPNDMNLALGRSNGWPVLTVFRVRYGQYVNVITPLN